MQEGSIWGRLEKQHRRTVDVWIDWTWVILLLLAAVLIFTINLGGLPLRDWDEGTVAQVAREIWRAPANSMPWLYPTLGGEPYYNKPPLVHLLIAGAYALGGVNEWTARLPGAILTAISVPLLYLIGREIFHVRYCAIYSALVYLTMLPVVRHGRLAMLDGAVVCFFLLTVLCLLRSRRDLRYCLGVGIGLGLIALTKGIMAILLAGVAAVFIFWDTPRLLTSWYLWIGLVLGTVPATAWYVCQWLHYGHNFTQVGMMNQSLGRIWSSVEGNSGAPWYYVLEILKYNHPWLLFLPVSFRFCWQNRNLNWAKLVLVWSCLYLVVISLMGTKLPWYVFPIYPSLALVVGAKLGDMENFLLLNIYPRSWVIILALLGVIATGGSIYYGWGTTGKPDLQLILAAVAATMALSAILVERGDGQFIRVLFWGSYVSLLLLMKSNYWVWELGERYEVKPVAAIVQQGTPVGSKVYTSNPEHRPSLDFYSDRHVIPASVNELKYNWQLNPHPYFLLDESALHNLDLPQMQLIDQAGSWTLVTKKPPKSSTANKEA
ncbi:ArnT family glycosyltransferase [Calothrix sp. 336/3]|uniref:ArnT family glycosyltransferase n=1 Tax=Calothrix sp. 336/3 TaxID=1337936 RepID=UPI0004E2E44B|nr:glycosyltransferase family 39 protein [Calothrix sp. 336/3]AKG20613.1 glycosyltransferase [Calothrix sp. 336/3]